MEQRRVLGTKASPHTRRKGPPTLTVEQHPDIQEQGVLESHTVRLWTFSVTMLSY